MKQHQQQRRDYVADRRTYRHDGTRDYTSGGWMPMRWDERLAIYVEGACFRTRREAEAALREDGRAEW